MQFAPRLRDLTEHKLYCFDPSPNYRHLESLLGRPLDLTRLLDGWDELLRVAASLKLGWVTASTLISKLQAYPRQHPLTGLLQEYGRLVKTLFILHYLEDEAYRRRILTQLNKSEAIHRLRRFLFFDNQGRLRHRQQTDIVNQVSCLHLLSNAIVVWNTVYMQAALDELSRQGHAIKPEAVTQLSPVSFEHINPYGTFNFEITAELTDAGLRPLRST